MLKEVLRTKEHQILCYNYIPKIEGISAPKKPVGKKRKWIYNPNDKKEAYDKLAQKYV